MTNELAIGLGLCIVVGILGDAIFAEAEHVLFLAKKSEDMLEWLMFMR